MRLRGLAAAILILLFAWVWERSDHEVSPSRRDIGTSPAEQMAGRVASENRREPFHDEASPGSPALGKTQSNARKEQIQSKIAAIDSQISEAESRLQNARDQAQSSNIDQQIQSLQSAIIDLQGRQSGMQYQAKSNGLNQSLIQQNNLMGQQKLTGLQQQIQSQQLVENTINQQIRNTTAPDNSDILVELRKELEEAHRKTMDLQDQYQSVLADQQQTASRLYSNQAQQDTQQQAGVVSTDVALQQSKEQLQSLLRQQQQMGVELEQSQKRVDDLRAERADLVRQLQ